MPDGQERFLRANKSMTAAVHDMSKAARRNTAASKAETLAMQKVDK